MDSILLAVVLEEPNGVWNKSEIFLINPTSKTFLITQVQGAFDGSDDEFLDLGSGDVGTFKLLPNSFYKVDEMKDVGELDFTTWYKFTVKDEETGEVSVLNGSLTGMFILRGKKILLPLIHKEGLLAELK